MKTPVKRQLDEVKREHERALRKAQDTAADALRLGLALDAMSQGVIICNERGKVVFRNTHAEALVGARHSDAVAGRAVEALLEAARRGEAQHQTLELHGPPPRTLVLTGMAIRHGDEEVGTIAVIEDISERRHLEAVRRDFVANVSHELRTPVGALGVLAETLAGESDASVVRRLAGRIGAEARRVGRIIEDLLDLSRIEAPEGAQVREPVALKGVVAAAIDRVRPTAERRHLGLRLLEEPTAYVLGDERQLVSAMVNLLDNAIKYSDSHAPVEVGTAEHDGVVDLIVRDEGIGIPGRDIERIFERFYRVDRARSRQTGGTGLGLSIVRHIATNHGGDVLVESREGEGSTFTLRLPVGNHDG